MQQDKIICIFGGSGFIGQHVTQELARAGYRIKIATRIPESAYQLKTYGNIGQITPFLCDYNDPKQIAAAVHGCDGAINLIGILYQKGKNNFKRAHVDIPNMIAKACKKENVEKFIHVSALEVDKSKSKYAQSKVEGEKVIKKAFPNVTVLRPSVVFGAGDNFFNMFAKMAIFLPALPLIGGGKTKFQPVFVGDIAQSVKNIMVERTDKYHGNTYHLGGPEVLSFKEIYERLLDAINRKTKLIAVPWGIAKIQGFVLGMLPKPLLTLDQVKSLKTDNVVPNKGMTFLDLDVQPTAIDSILPKYLSCYKRGGRFADKKEA